MSEMLMRHYVLQPPPPFFSLQILWKRCHFLRDPVEPEQQTAVFSPPNPNRSVAVRFLTFVVFPAASPAGSLSKTLNHHLLTFILSQMLGHDG